MAELFAGNEADFEEGDCRVITGEDLEIGVIRVDGDFFAYENYCPHQGGPVCQGRLFGKVEEIIAPDRTHQGMKFSEDRVNIVCPWHGYEYDVKTGIHPGDPGVRLRKFEVSVRSGDVFVLI